MSKLSKPETLENGKEEDKLDRYFADSRSWGQDRQDGLRDSRRIAWIVAMAAGLIAVCEALALVILMPLKTVQPYTLMVDRQTGFVQAMKPLDAQMVSSDTALTHSFLVQYVIAREGYDYSILQRDYRKVALWSAGTARASYIASMQASNPDSPLARYPRSTSIDVAVKSVTSLNPQSSLVRFETRRRDASGQAGAPQSWASVVRYRYSGEPMSVADRFVNPLGFQVTRYRRSAEVLSAPQPDTPTPIQQGMMVERQQAGVGPPAGELSTGRQFQP